MANHDDRAADMGACVLINAGWYKSLTSSSIGKGFFDKRDFIYNRLSDTYRCPTGQTLPLRSGDVEHGSLINLYWYSKCRTCALKSSCTTGPERKVRLWESEDVLDAAQRRLDLKPDMMKVRWSTVKNPFGTIKSWMGSTHFLTRTLNNVGTETSLHVLAYYLKRVLKIIGIQPLLVAIRSCKANRPQISGSMTVGQPRGPKQYRHKRQIAKMVIAPTSATI